MIARFGGEEALVAAAQRSASEIPEEMRGDVAVSIDRGRRVAEDCAQAGAHILFRGGPGWPASLECLHDAPEVLFVRGRIAAFDERAVAIVGSREGTAEGKDLAFRIAAGLAAEGWGSVSGLARGVDAAAHRGTLAGGGDTIAVLGCGIDQRYPEENRDLFDRIVEEGLVVSEFAPGMPPVSGNFPRRNRILAGLASAAVLVECRKRSGALITCRHALEQGKEIFVVPGWPGSPLAAGPLQLLREGARPIRGAEDLLEDLGGIPGELRPAPAAEREEWAAAELAPRDAAALEELLGAGSAYRFRAAT
jgi:DNA processing protein